MTLSHLHTDDWKQINYNNDRMCGHICRSYLSPCKPCFDKRNIIRRFCCQRLWLGLLSCVGSRVGTLWRIKQAPEEIQGGNTECEHSERKRLWGSGNTIPQESWHLLCPGDQIPWWQLPHSQGQGHQVQALLVRKRQRHNWCRSVCSRRVDRESFWGAESLQQNHLSEAYSRPACSYLSVCVCPAEWSKWWG